MSEKLPFGFRQDREPEREEPPHLEISVTACTSSMAWSRVVIAPANPRA